MFEVLSWLFWSLDESNMIQNLNTFDDVATLLEYVLRLMDIYVIANVC